MMIHKRNRSHENNFKDIAGVLIKVLSNKVIQIITNTSLESWDGLRNQLKP